MRFSWLKSGEMGRWSLGKGHLRTRSVLKSTKEDILSTGCTFMHMSRKRVRVGPLLMSQWGVAFPLLGMQGILVRCQPRQGAGFCDDLHEPFCKQTCHWSVWHLPSSNAADRCLRKLNCMSMGFENLKNLVPCVGVNSWSRSVPTAWHHPLTKQTQSKARICLLLLRLARWCQKFCPFAPPPFPLSSLSPFFAPSPSFW